MVINQTNWPRLEQRSVIKVFGAVSKEGHADCVHGANSLKKIQM